MKKLRIVFYVMCITLSLIGTGWAGKTTPPAIDWQLEALKKDIQIINLTITIFQKQLVEAQRVYNAYLFEIKERQESEDLEEE